MLSILTGSVSSVYVGVDGYPRGWVAVALDQRGGFADSWVATTLEQLLDGVAPGPAVGVDIPLGLLDTGWRTADRATAQLLGPRRASVFAVPPRSVWSADSLAEANRLCRQLCDGGGFSVQAWGLRTKVLEADAYRDRSPHDLIEVHPELAFAGLAGAAMAHPKKSWNGQNDRRRALAAAGVRIPDQLPRAGTVPVDDLLDAAAVAWCVRGHALGGGVRVPEPPDQYDHRGRPIVING